MTGARTQPYVPLETFLELESEPGTWLEWCAGLVYAMSGGSPEHSRLCVRISGALLARFGATCTI